MDKKDKIDTLIDQYLNFYQHGSQAIEPQQSTDFDSLMKHHLIPCAHENSLTHFLL